MRLVCPNCDTQYEVDASMIPPSGRDVQCSNCGWTWFQDAQQREAPIEAQVVDEAADAARSGSGLDDQAASFFERRPGAVAASGGTDVLEAEAPSDGDQLVARAPDVSAPDQQVVEQTPETAPSEDDAGTVEEAVIPEAEAVEEASVDEDASDERSEVAEDAARSDEDVEPKEHDPLGPFGASAVVDTAAKVDQPIDAVVVDAAPAPTAPEDQVSEAVEEAVEASQEPTEDVQADDAQPEDSEPALDEPEEPDDREDQTEDRVEDDSASDDDAADEAEDEPAAVAPGARPRPIDTHVLGILRAEAEREIAQRRAEESGSLETQPDLGLADPANTRAEPGRDERLARLRGEDADGFTDTPAREDLPDVDDINASLTATSDRGADMTLPVATEVLRRRAGFRLGFSAVMIAVVAVVLVYLNAPQIAEALPVLEPALASYVDWANGFRLGLETFLSQTVDRITGGARAG